MEENNRTTQIKLLSLYTFPILARDNWKCKVCNSNEDLTIDHKIPLSKGGETKAYNLQTLCRRCNSIKATKSYDFFKPIANTRVNKSIDEAIQANLRKQKKNSKKINLELIFNIIPKEEITMTQLFNLIQRKGIKLSYRSLQRYIVSMEIAKLINRRSQPSKEGLVGNTTYIKRI